jgi:hypothetical protein
MVETINLGKPIGSASRKAVVQTLVFPDPPAPMTPEIDSSACRRESVRLRAWVIVFIAEPREGMLSNKLSPRIPLREIFISVESDGSYEPMSSRMASHFPPDMMVFLMKTIASSFVSHVPMMATTGRRPTVTDITKVGMSQLQQLEEDDYVEG